MKIRLSILVFLGVILLPVCAVHAGNWNDSSITGECGADIAPSWNEEGHEYTTQVVALLAGANIKQAIRLSVFSQAPDHMAFRYSATSVGLWGFIPPWWGYRHRVLSILHSLHGGNSDAVNARRKKLGELLAKWLADDKPDWQTGFIVHAMGDSYAHVVGNGSNPERMHAYGQWVGHAFDNLPWGSHPDEISAKGVFKNYSDYVAALYPILLAKYQGGKGIDDFLSKVERAASDGNESAVINAICTYRAIRTRPVMSFTEGNELSRPNARNDIEKEVKYDEVKAFLKVLQSELEH